MYQAAWQQTSYRFSDLKELMAKATPLRSGDVLAGVAATSAEENVAAKMALADVPLRQFLTEAVVPYESDDVTRLILDSHDAAAFQPISPHDGRRIPRLALERGRDDRGVERPRARPHAGDGGCHRQDHAQPGSHPGGAQGRGGDALPRHHRPQGPHGGAPAAQSPHRRQARHRGLHRRRTDARVRRCRHRHQPGERQHRRDP